MNWANKLSCENRPLEQFDHRLVPNAECECLRCQISRMNFDKTDTFVLAISSHGVMKGGEPCIQMWDTKKRYLRHSDVIDALSDENCPKLKGKIRIVLWCACTKIPSRPGAGLSTEDTRQPDDASGIPSSNAGDGKTRSPSDNTSHNEGEENTCDKDSGKVEDNHSPGSSNERQPVLQGIKDFNAVSSLNGSTTIFKRFLQEFVQTCNLNERQQPRSDEASASGNIGNTQPDNESLSDYTDFYLDNVGEEQNESTSSDYDEDTSDDDESSDEEDDLSSDASSERQGNVPKDFLFVYSQKRSPTKGTWLMKELLLALNKYEDNEIVDFCELLAVTVRRMEKLAQKKNINFSGLVSIEHNLTRPVRFTKHMKPY